MAHGRVETTPEQQLAELRRAYERYSALAEQLKDSEDPAIDAELTHARALDALRIAHAYEKTIASTALRLESMHKTHLEQSGFTRLAKMLSLMLVIALILFAVSLASLRPDLMREILSASKPAAPAPMLASNPVAPPHAQPAPSAAKPATVEAPAPAARPAPPKQQQAEERKPQPAEAKPAPQVKAPAPQIKSPVPPARAAAPEAKPAPQANATAPEAKAAQPQAKTPPAVQLKAPSIPQASAPPESVVADQVNPPPAPLLQSSPVRPLSPPVNVTPLPEVPLQNEEPPKLVPVLRTHLRPPYPPMALRSGEQGTTQMQVTISTQGLITGCAVIQSSGSGLLDSSACAFVQRYWRWLPPTQNGQPASASTKISVIWNLANR